MVDSLAPVFVLLGLLGVSGIIYFVKKNSLNPTDQEYCKFLLTVCLIAIGLAAIATVM